jgi:2-oxoglutarate dehydrogenase E1 component
MKKIVKLFADRKQQVNGTKVFDWAMGELLAYGSLLMENHPVRLSGEDVKEGHSLTAMLRLPWLIRTRNIFP